MIGLEETYKTFDHTHIQLFTVCVHAYGAFRSITCRFLPETPPPPGEAATRAAAIAEGAQDNGEAAVEEQRRMGMLASA